MKKLYLLSLSISLLLVRMANIRTSIYVFNSLFSACCAAKTTSAQYINYVGTFNLLTHLYAFGDKVKPIPEPVAYLTPVHVIEVPHLQEGLKLGVTDSLDSTGCLSPHFLKLFLVGFNFVFKVDYSQSTELHDTSILMWGHRKV